MNAKWLTAALLFSVAVNIAAVGTLIYLRAVDRPQRVVELRRFGRGEWDEPPPFLGRSLPAPSARQVDSLRQQYHRRLAEIRDRIEAERRAILLRLEEEPFDSRSVEEPLHRMNLEQLRAERLTVDHLAALKPLLPEEDWRRLLRRLEAPPRRIILHDSTVLFLDSGPRRRRLEQLKIIERTFQQERRTR